MNAPVTHLPSHAPGRKATWFELFFDLVFVVAVAQLSGAYAHHYDVGGATVFALAFLAMWWCWLGHTFHATRFDAGSARRGIGFLQIAATVLIGYGASDPLGTRAWAFGAGLAAFKALLALAYGGERHWRGASGLIRVYSALYATQAMLWLLGVAATAGPVRWVAWGLALGLDLVSPWLVARHTAAVPPHPEHLPERFGLFTIILLGEGMASVVHALDHGAQLQPASVLAAVAGACLSFGIWVLYFDRVKGQDERHITDAGGGQRLRLWAYAHVPLYMGIASLAAGTVALAQPGALTPSSMIMYLAGLALAGLGLGLMGRARHQPQRA